MKIKLTRYLDASIFIAIFIVIAAFHSLAAVRANANPSVLLQLGSSSMAYGGVTTPEDIEQCRGTLKSIGASQISYASINRNGRYGSFVDLQQGLYINEIYTLNGIAPGYTLGWFLNQESSDFTVIALPNDPFVMSGMLIDSRQELRSISTVEMEAPQDWLSIINQENQIYNSVGLYGWVRSSSQDGDGPLLYLSDDYSSYLVAGQHTESAQEYFYLSATGKYYESIVDTSS
jgi:hypothetical protein